jgi:hypothetical protein
MASSYGFLTSLLNGLTGNNGLHDYAHAAQVFRTNGFSRSPKYKYLFYVNFVISKDAPSNIGASEIGMLVKSVELPKFTVDVKDLNQYNRHTYIQDRIKYEPVSIKFHDDNNNGLRQLWADYYNYYFADGTYDYNIYNVDDRYTSQNYISAWGLDNGSDVPFFGSIEIYSMYGGQSNKITLMNPVITSFSHDTHAYDEALGIMEATMQIRYNGVTYEEGFVAGIPGFSESSSYDSTFSPLSNNLGGGYYVNPITGQLEQQNASFSNRNGYNNSQVYYSPEQQGQQLNPTVALGLTALEVAAISQNAKSVQSSGGIITPTADTTHSTVAVAVPLVAPRPPDLNSSTAQIDGVTQNNTSPYLSGSWQNILYNQHYTTDRINSAESYVSSIPTNQLKSLTGFSNNVTSQAYIAQQYIDNPTSLSSTNIGASASVNYGQPNQVPSSLSFTDPTTPPSSTYSGNDWRIQLQNENYSQNDIALAATQISKLNIAPGVNLTNLAKSYIQASKTNTPNNIV